MRFASSDHHFDALSCASIPGKYDVKGKIKPALYYNGGKRGLLIGSFGIAFIVRIIIIIIGKIQAIL
jgi:hypothetical protein